METIMTFTSLWGSILITYRQEAEPSPASQYTPLRAPCLALKGQSVFISGFNADLQAGYAQ
jgi:hypothetical protein